MDIKNINWTLFEKYNLTDARQRPSIISKILSEELPEYLNNIVLKSHFVIPYKTKFECQKCGECCRYARKVASLRYEPCSHLSDNNQCSKHDSKYLVCKLFPFYVIKSSKYGNILTIKPYCSGYGKGEVIDYDKFVNKILKLQETSKINRDGAFVIHELLYLPTIKEWVFPSKLNIDTLLQYINKVSGKKEQSVETVINPTELHYAQTTTNRLLGGLDEPQATITEDGYISDVNESFCKLLETDKKLLAGTNFYNLFIDKEKIEREFNIGLSYGKLNSLPEKIRTKNGNTKNILINAVSYRSRRDGLVHGMLICIKEISDELYRELSQSKNYARGLIEANLDLLVFLDKNGVITDINQSCCDLIQKKRSDIIGTNFVDYFDNKEDATKGIETTYKNGLVKDYVLNINSKNENIPVSFNACVYKDSDGITQGIFASARDIRETQKLISDLAAAQNYSRSLIESSLDIMLTVSKNGIIMDVNNSACRAFGVQRDELIGSSFCSYFESESSALTMIDKTFKHEQLKAHKIVLVNSSFNKINLSFNATVYRDTENNICGLFAIAREA